jgi:hypothetical protein
MRLQDRAEYSAAVTTHYALLFALMCWKALEFKMLRDIGLVTLIFFFWHVFVIDCTESNANDMQNYTHAGMFDGSVCPNSFIYWVNYTHI